MDVPWAKSLFIANFYCELMPHTMIHQAVVTDNEAQKLCRKYQNYTTIVTHLNYPSSLPCQPNQLGGCLRGRKQLTKLSLLFWLKNINFIFPDFPFSCCALWAQCLTYNPAPHAEPLESCQKTERENGHNRGRRQWDAILRKNVIPWPIISSQFFLKINYKRRQWKKGEDGGVFGLRLIYSRSLTHIPRYIHWKILERSLIRSYLTRIINTMESAMYTKPHYSDEFVFHRQPPQSCTYAYRKAIQLESLLGMWGAVDEKKEKRLRKDKRMGSVDRKQFSLESPSLSFTTTLLNIILSPFRLHFLSAFFTREGEDGEDHSKIHIFGKF